MTDSVTLEQMLMAREARAARQQELLREYRLPMVSFTMNIAGPEKNSAAIRQGFLLGQRLLLGQLRRRKAPILLQETINRETGCEGLYVVDLPAETLKTMCCEIEEDTPLGRLFDMDVLSPTGEKLERQQPRRCLLCGRPARECARSRSHSVAALQEKTHALLTGVLDAKDAEDAASLACRALLYEACTGPKPGLVDRFGNGSHRDMDIFSFMASTAALWPYFACCVSIGRQTASMPAPETLKALRWPGKQAEGSMLEATGGVNTHKGAIFSLGLVCGALGRLERFQWARPERVLKEVSAMSVGIVQRELESSSPLDGVTHGQQVFDSHGLSGVRGQAEAGFPDVLTLGLPILENGLAQGLGPDVAGGAALLALLSQGTDTNMVTRGGWETAQAQAAFLRELLAQTPYPGRVELEALDREYTAANLSPGGSADLLAMSYLLHFLRQEEV